MSPFSYLIIAAACCFYIGLIYSIPSDAKALLVDPDSAWHLAAGDLIRTLGTIPQHDPWSFTAGNEYWYNVSWGYDVIISHIHSHLGWYGQIATASVLASLTAAIIFYHACIRSNHLIASLLITSWALLSSIVYLRPFLVSNTFIGLCLLLFFQVYRCNTSERKLWILPIIVAIWVNIHGGFIMLGILGAAYFLEDCISRRFLRAQKLCGIGIICLLATACNPYGFDLANGLWRTLNSELKVFISEWQPLTFTTENALTWVYISIFTCLLFWRKAYQDLQLAERFLLIVSLFMAFMAVRNITFFILVSVPIMATVLGNILRTSKAKTPGKAECWFDEICIRLNRPRTAVFSMSIAVVATVSLFHPAIAQRYEIHDQDPYENISSTIAWVQAHYPDKRFLNDYMLGGPIIYLTHGKLPVFIDGRAETAYPKEVTRDFVVYQLQLPHWEGLIDKYALDGLILYGNSLGKYLRQSPKWTLVSEENNISVWLYNRIN
jgi:hypothetical protein